MNKFAKVYYDPSNPGSFGGINRLWKEVGGSKTDVEEWLKTQDTYTLHRPAKKKIKRNKILVAGLDDQWEADLIDVQGISKYNNNIKFLLTCIDTLSKYAFVVPLKDKSAESIVKAFTKIFKIRQPRKLRTDSGKEFLNKKFQSYLKSKSIIFFTSKNETKSAIVERFNRTIMSKVWRFFTASKQERYVDVLDHLVKSYNQTIHTSTGMPPAQINVMNGESVWRKMYNFPSKTKRQRTRHRAGDLVRISKTKKTFEKGYRPNWTREIFKVVKVYKRKLPEYRIEDLQGEDILGKFLDQELQSVNPNEVQNYKIKKIVRTRGQGLSKEHLVSWQDYPDTFQTWIATRNMDLYK